MTREWTREISIPTLAWVNRSGETEVDGLEEKAAGVLANYDKGRDESIQKLLKHLSLVDHHLEALADRRMDIVLRLSKLDYFVKDPDWKLG